MTTEQTMTDLTCKLCGSSNVRFQFSEDRGGMTYSSYHCGHCDLYQTLGEIDDVSPDYVNLEEADLAGEHVYIQQHSKKAAFAQWLAEVDRLAGKPRDDTRRSVLDIGCGVGGFLDFARDNGFATYGFDASRAQVEVAQRSHPMVRHAVSIDEYMASFEVKPRIDCVTMWDVFEHIRDPKSLLSGVRNYLHADTIFYVSVPNGKPNPAKIKLARARKREIGLIPWEHVFYYTPSSLARVFRENGYEPLQIGGVKPYVRDMNAFEMVRRGLHTALASTPYAFQISAFAKPAHQD